jgi:hypothetical protein
MVLSFTHSNVREKSVGREAAIEGAFKELCRNDKAFLHSLETTTKSLNATYTRISKWNQKLNDILDAQIPVPELIDNRII